MIKSSGTDKQAMNYNVINAPKYSSAQTSWKNRGGTSNSARKSGNATRGSDHYTFYKE